MENLPNGEVQGQSTTRYRVFYVSPVQTGEPPYTMASGMEYVPAYALESWLRNRPGTLISGIETTWSA